MTQTEARELSARINSLNLTTPAVAMTRDHYHGRWEDTHVWGVVYKRDFFASEDELPDDLLAILPLATP